MTFIAHLHPLLVHFPIALVVVAAVCELVAIVNGGSAWHIVATANVRAGALFGMAAAATGWLLASVSQIAEASLEWHRWMGAASAVAAIAAASATMVESRSGRALYRILLFSAAALVGVTGHLGGVLVWGADFFGTP